MNPQQELPVLTFSLQNSADGVHLLLALPLAPQVLLLLSYFLSLCLTPQPSFFTLLCKKFSLCSAQHISLLCSLQAEGEYRHLSVLGFQCACSFTFLYPHAVCHVLLAICMTVTIASSLKHLLFILPLFL